MKPTGKKRYSIEDYISCMSPSSPHQTSRESIRTDHFNQVSLISKTGPAFWTTDTCFSNSRVGSSVTYVL